MENAQPEITQNPTQLEAVVSTLLAWFEGNRRTFSWRECDSPFYVLIAEILLRKTGAQAVERFLPSFLARFPDAATLASASVNDLAAALAPLGLSIQRAKQLHALALALLANHQGIIPLDVETLSSLPGVGRYTAGIVAATCGRVPEPAVDTNVARVIQRIFAITPSQAEPRKSVNIWAIADALVKRRPETPANVTWALLDLAATVCVSRNPNHAACPLLPYCAYARTENPRPAP